MQLFRSCGLKGSCTLSKSCGKHGLRYCLVRVALESCLLPAAFSLFFFLLLLPFYLLSLCPLCANTWLIAHRVNCSQPCFPQAPWGGKKLRCAASACWGVPVSGNLGIWDSVKTCQQNNHAVTASHCYTAALEESLVPRGLRITFNPSRLDEYAVKIVSESACPCFWRSLNASTCCAGMQVQGLEGVGLVQAVMSCTSTNEASKRTSRQGFGILKSRIFLVVEIYCSLTSEVRKMCRTQVRLIDVDVVCCVTMSCA